MICHDYPQLWDPTAAQSTRDAQYQAALSNLAANDPKAFAPFSAPEWIAQPFNEFDYCLQWPTASIPDPPKPANTPFPRVPTLVFTGDLDSNTSPEGAAMVARQFGGTLVENVNYTHVSALGDFNRCASRIAQRFVRTLSAGDTSCSKDYNENRLVPHFSKVTADMLGNSDDAKIVRGQHRPRPTRSSAGGASTGRPAWACGVEPSRATATPA